MEGHPYSLCIFSLLCFSLGLVMKKKSHSTYLISQHEISIPKSPFLLPSCFSNRTNKILFLKLVSKHDWRWPQKQKYCNVTDVSEGDFLQEQLIYCQGQVSLTTTLTKTTLFVTFHHLLRFYILMAALHKWNLWMQNRLYSLLYTALDCY